MNQYDIANGNNVFWKHAVILLLYFLKFHVDFSKHKYENSPSLCSSKYSNDTIKYTMVPARYFVVNITQHLQAILSLFYRSLFLNRKHEHNKMTNHFQESK